MKNIFIYIIIISIFSFNSFAQKAKISREDKKIETSPKDHDTLIDTKSTSTITIKSYHVEENINMRFGGYTMTYEVTNLNLINKYDLGPNNTRIITPRYKEIEPTYNKIEPININMVLPSFNEVKFPIQDQLKIVAKHEDKNAIDSTKSNRKYIYIHLIKTYERIAKKGYKSIEIFQRLGDYFFFDGDYTKAVKWYDELFKMATDLDSLYYDRYSYSLLKTGQKNKANEIMKKRKELFGTN